MVLRILILPIMSIILFSCNFPEQSSVVQSSSESPKLVKTRSENDYLWDTGTVDRQIYTGFSQIGSKWLCCRISRKDGKLWWFNKEGESRESLNEGIFIKEQNYEGIILKKIDNDTYAFDKTGYEWLEDYYKDMRFNYIGNGELEWHNGDQLITVFRK